MYGAKTTSDENTIRTWAEEYAKKKLTTAGHAADCHIIATELGIEKNGMAEMQYNEIEKVVQAVMDNGREKECTKN